MPLTLGQAPRSLLAQQLLAMSRQPVGLVSPSGVANKALQGLLMRREELDRRSKAEENQRLAEQLLGVPQPAQTGLADPRTGQISPQQTPRLLTEGDQRNQALASILSQNPQAMQQFAMSSLAPSAESSPFAKIDPSKFTPESVQNFQRSGGRDFSLLEVAPEPGDGPDIPKLINDIGDDLYKESTDFVIQRDAWGRIQAAARDPSAAGDLALVFSFMKAQDPNSVVRESEFATAANARGVPETVRNVWNRLLEGERLTPAQRNDFVTQAGNIFRQASADQDQRNQRFLTRAINANVPRSQFESQLIPLAPAEVPGQATSASAVESLPEGVTEEDIKFTMQQHGLTREEVLERINAAP